MQYLNCSDIHFRYPGRHDYLLENIVFELNDNDKVGLIGGNGSGKTTLLKLILGEITPLSGKISRSKGLRIGHLPQEMRFPGETSLRDYLWTARPGLAELKNRLEAVTDFSDENNLKLLSEFEARSGYIFEGHFDRTLAAFGLDDRNLSLPVGELSGGEKTKTALCRLLLGEPDILLLDEPTNHLDRDTLEWLEKYLGNLDIPFLAVSHDRRFLDNCIEEIWELTGGAMNRYGGNYSFYREEKRILFNRKMKDYEKQRKKIKQLKETARKRRDWAGTHQAETGWEGNAPVYESITNYARKAMKRAKNIESRIEAIIEKEEAEKPFVEKERTITVEAGELENRFVLKAENLGKSYDSRTVFSGLSFMVENGSRVAVTGKNGSGKTTLLRIIAGNLDGYDGRYAWVPRAETAYYAQEFENLDLSGTVIEQVVEGNKDQTKARTVLGCLNMGGDKVFMTVKDLSIGERSKVSLAKIILSRATVLILDEPTNHLETSAREAFEDALTNYSGTVIFASHDRYFTDKLAACRIDLDDPRPGLDRFRS